MTMNDSSKGTSSNASSNKFLNMTFFGKCGFVVKLSVFLITLGFAYPNILVD